MWKDKNGCSPGRLNTRAARTHCILSTGTPVFADTRRLISSTPSVYFTVKHNISH